MSLDWFTLRHCSNSFVSSILKHYWPVCNSTSHLALVQLTLKVALFIPFISMNVHQILNADYMLILPTTVSLKFSLYDLSIVVELYYSRSRRKRKKKEKNPKHLETLKIYFRSSILYVRFVLASPFCLLFSWNVTHFGLEPSASFSGVVVND